VDSAESAERVNRFSVQQRVILSEIPEGSQKIRWWISIPSDARNQFLEAMSIELCPGKWTIVTDAERRGQFLFVEVTNPTQASLEVQLSYTAKRSPEFVKVDDMLVGPLSGAVQVMLADHLQRDTPHMSVTEEVQQIADKVCGNETNLAIQARMLLAHVASTVDHYSYSPDSKMPTCGVGDSAICRKQGGGCCTDLNSYFISLARARGIPSRLQMGYRLQEKNRGKEVESGYRCWVEYYAPGYGWISADVVEADTPGGLGPERWFSGLTSRRIWLNEGREFVFAPDLAVGKVNHMSIGYAEIDGKPVRLLPEGELKPQLSRLITANE
jgi:transglutaminase-like putative cysteine protease